MMEEIEEFSLGLREGENHTGADEFDSDNPVVIRKVTDNFISNKLRKRANSGTDRQTMEMPWVHNIA